MTRVTPAAPADTSPAGDIWRPWRAAMADALYGPDGFYTRSDGAPARHFRTSVHASPLFAAAVLQLARTCELSTVVDVGAGRGELLAELHRQDPGLRLVGIEVAPLPADLPPGVTWTAEMPTVSDALVVANEWLDNVPLDVVELATDGPRLVVVDQEGRERLGGPATAADHAWLDAWWPLTEVGRRADVGRSRDEAWASVVSSVRRGVAVAVDYGHDRAGRPPHSTVAAYRLGRQVPPIPDGTCDLTAHVALDSCAAAGAAAGATETLFTTQRAALLAMGALPTGRPDLDVARTDPAGYLAALSAAGEAAELTDPAGPGGFGWLVQAVGMPVPDRLRIAAEVQPWTGTEA